MTIEKQQSDLLLQSTPFDILIVKDNPADIQLIETFLDESDIPDSVVFREHTLAEKIRYAIECSQIALPKLNM